MAASNSIARKVQPQGSYDRAAENGLGEEKQTPEKGPPWPASHLKCWLWHQATNGILYNAYLFDVRFALS
eukprot:CAMPEP_0204512466 /NCGR_PEP_ID=MMETSP0661-20131031/973_1 /ASSEMBLY_ACC=CAM_ASM_000606 /TAXON_ID=109239 /ORGANISM="Alexandrium margalefi, Strain AMGDE01CS-322" /LENGTH=69 /DNA_ID=CAMNT_0051517585 /DNA_START=47 /DNA_END=253 /DNA_ORIENTATION=+